MIFNVAIILCFYEVQIYEFLNIQLSSINESILPNKELLSDTSKSTETKDTDINFIIYPNPNNGNMQVAYEIPETGTFEIYDLFGKKLLSYPLYEGKNTFAISATMLNEGIYFYRATAGNKIIAKDKLVVIK